MTTEIAEMEIIETPVKDKEPMYHVYCGICHPDTEPPPTHAHCGHKFTDDKVEHEVQPHTCVVCLTMADEHFIKVHFKSPEYKRFPE